MSIFFKIIILTFSLYTSTVISMDLETSNILKHNLACLNCSKIHHACDKKWPTCGYCEKRGLNCQKNPSTKKRGRPFGSKNNKSEYATKELQRTEEMKKNYLFEIGPNEYHFNDDNFNSFDGAHEVQICFHVKTIKTSCNWCSRGEIYICLDCYNVTCDICGS